MTDRGRLETLDRQGCLDLLRTVTVGRLAWADRDERIQVRPVNFTLDSTLGTACVLVRCGDGEMLAAARDGRPFSFEADQIEPALRGGWSVLVVTDGVEISTTISTAGTGDTADADLPEPWAAGERPHVLRLATGHGATITGRWLRLAGGDISVVRVEPEPD
ncbi:pyridoxamine 5'-phosphate oxidase family protein [Pseudonocardia sp.]|uniref:pyridoxamine 5'-phosphate oxidase family protein n=1 Tax=Pseudonocardia sp. TaxID=60912 RepID=UPI003D09DB88